MPTLPTNSKCSTLGCKNPRSKLNTSCTEHGGLNSINTQERKEFTSMYQTNQWRSLRQVQLSKHPLCESCMTMGKVVQANHVDHVFPWAKIGKQAFYNNLFQSLCTHCHSYKSAKEKQGIYTHYSTGRQYTPNDYRLTIKDSSYDNTPNVL